MLYEKFLDTINRFFPTNPLNGLEDALAELDPDKIYLENVRSLLGVSSSRAKEICETAVRQGLLSRAVEVLCPDGSVAYSAASEADLPPTVNCWLEDDGAYSEVLISTSTLNKLVFYKLND